jgi:hypothetical protein
MERKSIANRSRARKPGGDTVTPPGLLGPWMPGVAGPRHRKSVDARSKRFVRAVRPAFWFYCGRNRALSFGGNESHDHRHTPSAN